MAFLSLDAADREHRLTRHVDQVNAHGEADDASIRKAELARTNKGEVIAQVVLEELLVDAVKTDLERQGYVIREGQRRRAGASFTAIDRDKVSGRSCGAPCDRSAGPKIQAVQSPI